MIKNDRPIRVAHIMGKLLAGGVEMVVFNYYREIDKTKIQFDFYYDSDSTVEPPEDLIRMGARFFKVPPYQNTVTYLITLRKYFRKYDYKIIHSHINTLSLFPLFIAWDCEIPIRIAHNHSVPSGKEIRRDSLKCFLRLFAKLFATDYFACSEKAGRWMWGDKSFDQNNVIIIKNAVNFDRFTPDVSKIQQLKKELNLEGKFVIGHVGRFTSAKNHKFLINVFTKISSIKENAVLLLVGDGELNRDIHRWIKSSEIESKVIFIGKVNNPEDYYPLFHVFALPSIFEGLPITVIESQISGTPVVASKAVPNEAIISDACSLIELDSGTWVNFILDSIGKNVILNERSKEYNIKFAARKLETWYLTRVGSLYKN